MMRETPIVVIDTDDPVTCVLYAVGMFIAAFVVLLMVTCQSSPHAPHVPTPPANVTTPQPEGSNIAPLSV